MLRGKIVYAIKLEEGWVLSNAYESNVVSKILIREYLHQSCVHLTVSVSCIFQSMVRGILEPEMSKLTNDSPHRKRVIKLACKIGVQNCTKMALDLFEDWKENKTRYFV